MRDGRVLASVEMAEGRVAKARGLLGRRELDGVMLIRGVRSVHTFFMAFDLDVAFLDSNMVVIRTMRLHRNRVTLPVWRARAVVEAPAGAFGQWDLNVGDEIEIRSCTTPFESLPTDEASAGESAADESAAP
ncbi:MAG: DUF192 domain-containing protein [Acidimicrobiia bacterium]|nr:DUF192 domain-containing protein [Acidimicrobiia bacterium]